MAKVVKCLILLATINFFSRFEKEYFVLKVKKFLITFQNITKTENGTSEVVVEQK